MPYIIPTDALLRDARALLLCIEFEFNSFWFCQSSCFLPYHLASLDSHMTQLLFEPKGKAPGQKCTQMTQALFSGHVCLDKFLFTGLCSFPDVFSGCHVNKWLMSWPRPFAKPAGHFRTSPWALLQSYGGWNQMRLPGPYENAQPRAGAQVQPANTLITRNSKPFKK